MKVFLTADTHFGHEKIIEYCARPFKNVAEMNQVLVENWNATITRDTVVYHLGDFIWTRKAIADILPRLNGKIKLVYGGHDFPYLNMYKKYPNITVLSPLAVENINGTVAVLCHFPLRSWERKEYGACHFYGHTHGNLLPLYKSWEVGVDCNNFYPISLEEAIEKANYLED